MIGQIVTTTESDCIVELKPASNELISEDQMSSRLFIALGDFVLRERLEHETRNIRELIVRQAFERSNLQWPDLDSARPGDDPLRFGVPDIETGRTHT